MRFSNTDGNGKIFGVIMIKAAYDISEDGICHVAPEQEPFNFTDVPHGELNTSSLRHPSDLVGFKCGTDIIVDAVAHAPGRDRVASWLAGVRVVDGNGTSLEKTVRVCGPRQWHPIWRRHLSERERTEWRKYKPLFDRWELSSPEPIASLPLRYEFAYGGSVARGIDQAGQSILEAYEYNPTGCGWIDPDVTDHTAPVTAPQIEDPLDPISNVRHSYAPAGLGAVPPAWLPRRSLGGTFDEQWQKTVWPKWPSDYDFAYNHSAATGLTSKSYLGNGVRIEMQSLRPERAVFIVQIPDANPLFLITSADRSPVFVRPNLDTIFLDVASPRLFDCRIHVTWRGAFSLEKTLGITVFQAHDDQLREVAAKSAVVQSEHPSECSTALTLPEFSK